MWWVPWACYVVACWIIGIIVCCFLHAIAKEKGEDFIPPHADAGPLVAGVFFSPVYIPIILALVLTLGPIVLISIVAYNQLNKLFRHCIRKYVERQERLEEANAPWEAFRNGLATDTAVHQAIRIWYECGIGNR